jgi:hypothetical protein
MQQLLELMEQIEGLNRTITVILGGVVCSEIINLGFSPLMCLWTTA